jgi:hypothetical protein
MGHALFSQVTDGSAAYDYGGTAELDKRTAEGRGIRTFNPEQQAQLIADFWRENKANNPVASFLPYIAEVRAA